MTVEDAVLGAIQDWVGAQRVLLERLVFRGGEVLAVARLLSGVTLWVS